MKKSPVWIICQHAGSPNHGMNHRPYYLARQLAARGRDVTVVSGATSHEYFAPPKTTGFHTVEMVDGLRYVWIRTPRYDESRSARRVFTWLWYLAGLMRLTRLGLPVPGTIIVSSPPPFPILPAVGLAKQAGARLIFEVRDIWPLSLVELGDISPRHPLIRVTQWVEDFAYRRSDVVVAVLPAALDHMRSRGLDDCRFAHVPNGVDVGADAGVRADPRVRQSLVDRRVIVGYAGKVGIAYGIGNLIAAARRLRDRKEIGIVIVGAGTELEGLVAEARRDGLDNIAFIPRVPKKEMPGILAAFDICYLGLRHEPVFRFGVSPTKLFDYLLAAKPVIMAARAGNDPVTEAGCGRTVEPENPDALAAAIIELAELSPEEWSRLGQAGRRYVLEHHDWDLLGSRYETLLAP